ncbi:MAG: efflux RND transporter periplasmic adaptor subunit [Rubrivivax sp.]|nr:efflux RND transporter periplasmic adaptor subunit [Rubrivivax sp.]
MPVLAALAVALAAAAAAFAVALPGGARANAAAGSGTATGQAVPALASVTVAAGVAAEAAVFDGVVEAVRQTVLAAQVPGAVVALAVKAGDRVKAGQVLMRLDARAAEQQAGAAAAQVLAARALLDAAAGEYQRQQQLHAQNYISAAALERAKAQFESAQAQAAAQVAAAGAARTESGFYVVRAPYDGVVSEVPVVLGDMAMPGRALATLYDPAAMRVSAAVPHSAAPRAAAGTAATNAAGAGAAAAAAPAPMAEIPGAAPERIAPLRWQALPAADPATHTVTLRLDLPAGTAAVPGAFARVWLPGRAATATAATASASAVAGADATRLAVPARAIVRRAELTAVYVLAADGRPLLRQVRLGRADSELVEVLSGVAAGERVALDPQAAARVR